MEVVVKMKSVVEEVVMEVADDKESQSRIKVNGK